MAIALSQLANLYRRRSPQMEADFEQMDAPLKSPLARLFAAKSPDDRINPGFGEVPDPPPLMIPSPANQATGKMAMEGMVGRETGASPLAGLMPKPLSPDENPANLPQLMPVDMNRSSAGFEGIPSSGEFAPVTDLDRARMNVENTITDPVKKQSKWKDVLAYAAQFANNVFNPNKQVEYGGWGKVKHDKAVNSALAAYAPLAQMQNQDIERQGKITAQDYQKAQVGNLANLAEDRRTDNARLDKKLDLDEKKADARLVFDNWRMKNGDAKQLTYRDYVTGQLELGNKKYLSQTEFNKEKLEFENDRLKQQKQIADDRNATTLQAVGQNNQTRREIANSSNALREQIANGSAEQRNKATEIAGKYKAADIVTKGRAAGLDDGQINEALRLAGFPPIN